MHFDRTALRSAYGAERSTGRKSENWRDSIYESYGSGRRQMKHSVRKVRLTGLDVLYLRKASFLPSDFQRQLFDGESNHRVFEVSSDLAEECRSAFTERLAVVGFDDSYELTSEGRRLEDLIDKFAEP